MAQIEKYMIDREKMKMARITGSGPGYTGPTSWKGTWKGKT
jgi:hypothetical protein